MNAAAEDLEKINTPEKSGPKLGVFDDISNHDYHRGGGISKSGLDLIRQSPEHYITNRRNPRPSTPAMMLGTAVHTLVLEPEKFDDEYCMEPVGAPKRPTAAQLNAKKPSPDTLVAIAFWKEWDAENAGKIALSTKPGDDPFWQPSDWCRIHRMRDAILLHPIASILLDHSQGRAERSIYWLDREDDFGVREPTHRLCKARADFHNQAHNLLVDLKTTEDASFTGFSQSVGKYRYYVQDPWYRSGWYHATGDVVSGFVFVAVEKLPPYGVGIYRLPEDATRIGRQQMLADLDLYHRCKRDDHWPAYPDDIRDLQLSQWQLRGHIS